MSNSTYCEDHYEQPKWMHRIEELEKENKNLKEQLSKYEQMMKDAIEGVAHPDDQEIWCDLDKYNLEDCEKVQIIVIKED